MHSIIAQAVPTGSFIGWWLKPLISTVNGVIGWVPDEFLDYGEAVE